MFNTVSKQLVEHHSSQNVNYTNYSRIYKKKYTAASEMQCFRGFSFVYVKITGKAAIEAAFCVFRFFYSCNNCFSKVDNNLLIVKK